MKLRRLQINGFKSLDNLDVAIPRDLMFLLGVNGAGKSTVLQALSFVRAFANGKVDEFYSERGWQQQDTRPRIALKTLRTHSRPGTARVLPPRNLEISLNLVSDEAEVMWEFGWGYTVSSVVFERIWIRPRGEKRARLSFSYARPTRSASGDNSGQLKLEDLRLPGSLLSIIAANRLSDTRDVPVLNDVKHWADGITSLELLSPAAMRRGIRGRPKDIGPRGERLAGFIAALSASKREELVSRVARFYPLASVETIRKTAGWIDMRILENYDNIARISPIHMSDGFMRILALCAIPEFDDNVSTVLLDEVEDGIEPHILPDLIKFISKSSSCQFIMTSHSPYLINFFEPEQVYFLARRDDGQTIVARSDEMEMFLEGGEYFGVGEIWANASLKTITDAVKKSYQSKAQPAEIEDNDDMRVANFLEGK